MTTMDDVARLAGVSRMTVSNALRGKASVRPRTAQKVARAARELGYRPNLAARKLSSGKTGVIGFSTVELDYSRFSADLAAAVSDLAFERGYQTLIQQTRYSQRYERSMVSSVATEFCEGTILSASSLPVPDIIALGERQPVVVFDDYRLVRRVDSVLSPCREGAKAAVSHLLGLGCERILVLGVGYDADDSGRQSSKAGGLRLQGAMDAMRERGGALGPAHAHDCGWDYDSAYRTMRTVIGDGMRFDGVFCVTDVVAFGALRALCEAGLSVPDDVALIGFDGLKECELSNPPISTVAIDTKNVACACLDLLMRRIRRPDVPVETRTVPFELVPRQSSMPGTGAR